MPYTVTYAGTCPTCGATAKVDIVARDPARLAPAMLTCPACHRTVSGRVVKVKIWEGDT